ncbi:hypothetical protein FTT16_08460 [Campylobacter jejuni]|nr:hypothetical protein [Campylobacter jejuni]
MKKIIFTISALLIINANAFNIGGIEYGELSGDERLACEALLCLAAPVVPAECTTAIAKYFSIKFRKPWKTFNARKSFLNLCKTQSNISIGGSDEDMQNWKDTILQLNEGCNVNQLNQRIEKKVLYIKKVCTSNGHGEGTTCNDIKVYGYRINSQLTNDCRLLSQHNFSKDNYKLKYVCNGKFYEEDDWYNGYEKQEITKEEYEQLKEEERIALQIKENRFQKPKWHFYKKLFINKVCWINEA